MLHSCEFRFGKRLCLNLAEAVDDRDHVPQKMQLVLFLAENMESNIKRRAISAGLDAGVGYLETAQEHTFDGNITVTCTKRVEDESLHIF